MIFKSRKTCYIVRGQHTDYLGEGLKWLAWEKAYGDYQGLVNVLSLDSGDS